MQVAVLILAAGASRRLGRPKQLVEYQDETLLARAIRLSHEAGAARIVVVLGSSADEVAASLHSTPANLVINQDWEQGIASSIHAGLSALEELAPRVDGVLLLTCDQPRLTREHLVQMLDVFQQSGGILSIGSAYGGTLGVPALFPRQRFAELYTLRGDQGARLLLKGEKSSIREVELPGGEIDIDTPADLNQLT